MNIYLECIKSSKYLLSIICIYIEIFVTSTNCQMVLLGFILGF